MAEVDAFVEDLKGLVLMDLESNTVQEKSVFKMPGLVLADVTQEEFIAGGLLAGKTYDDISSELKRFNYRRLE